MLTLSNRLTDTLTGERFCKGKRTFQVLQCQSNDLMRWVLWTLEVILIIVVVFGFCGSLWAGGDRTVRLFVVAIFCLTLLTTFWKGLGAVHENSAEVLAKWKKDGRLPLRVRKFLRSTR